MSRPIRQVYCPGCGQVITVSPAGVTECGGEGEGVCAATIYAFDLRDNGPEYARAEWLDAWDTGEGPPDAHHADVIVRAHTVAGA